MAHRTLLTFHSISDDLTPIGGFYFALFSFINFTVCVLQYRYLLIFGQTLNFCVSNHIGLMSTTRPNVVIFFD